MSESVSRVIDSVPPFKDNGYGGVMGAQDEGFTLQSKQITQPGAAPLVVDLAAEGFKVMADTAYTVVVDGETAARVTVDQSTITETGFNVLGGAITEIIHVQICGRIAGQKA